MFLHCQSRICMVSCIHEQILYVFSKYLVMNRYNYKLNTYVVFALHEQISYVFSNHLFENRSIHTICIYYHDNNFYGLFYETCFLDYIVKVD